MEQNTQLKLIAERIQILLDSASAHKIHMEEIFFRAQRIAAALRNNQPIRDNAFPMDFQIFRKQVRTLMQAAFELVIMISQLERDVHPDPLAVRQAQTLSRQASLFQKIVRDFQEQSRLAYQYIRFTESKTEAVAMNLDIEKMSEKVEVMPGHTAAVLRKISEGLPPEGGAAGTP